MPATTTCPHCGKTLRAVQHTRRCPYCGKVVLVKTLGASVREARTRSERFLQRMSLFQGQVLVARVVLILLALALIAFLVVGC